MMLLLRRGDKAMISETAAMPIAIIAVVAGSMGIKYLQFYSSSVALMLSTFFRDHPTVLYGLNVMQ